MPISMVVVYKYVKWYLFAKSTPGLIQFKSEKKALEKKVGKKYSNNKKQQQQENHKI